MTQKTQKHNVTKSNVKLDLQIWHSQTAEPLMGQTRDNDGLWKIYDLNSS